MFVASGRVKEIAFGDTVLAELSLKVYRWKSKQVHQ